MNSSIICKKIDPQDKELMEQVYRLRYQVYVRERGFLPQYISPEGVERDAFDPHSIHFVALNEHEEAIGTVRLILSELNPTQLDQYHKTLKISVEHTLFPYAEISRFCISKAYMRRFILNNLPTQNYLNPIAFGFYKAILQECDALDIQTVFALIEEPLAKMLKRSGLKLERVGEKVDIYGFVRPYKFVVQEQREPIERFYQNLEPILA